jgi:hypothetical protein
MTARHSHEPRRSRPHPSLRRRIKDRGGAQPTVIDLPDVDLPAPDGSVHWVRVTCPECGIVRVPTERVVVRNCVDDQTWSYRARCSECETTFLGDTPEGLALAALAAGVSVELWTLPIPSARRPGPPIQATDLLTLHLELLEFDWFDRLSRVEPPLGDR